LLLKVTTAVTTPLIEAQSHLSGRQFVAALDKSIVTRKMGPSNCVATPSRVAPDDVSDFIVTTAKEILSLLVELPAIALQVGSMSRLTDDDVALKRRGQALVQP
jgi:hypothetical protein